MRISAIGRGSISSFLKVTVDIAWVLACAALGFIWIVTVISVFSLANGGHNLAMFERIVIAEPAGIARWTLQYSIACIGAMVVCSYLRGVFETLVNGDPFVPDNARRLRAIAVVLAILEFVRMTISVLVQILLGVFGVANEDGNPAINVSLNLSVWFSVLTLVVLAQVFSEGAALREEQKMTI